MTSALSIFKSKASQLLLISILFEIIFFFSFENIIGSVSLLAGWFLLSTMLLTPYNLQNYPVSFLMILGMSVFQYLLPLPFTLFEFKPVTFNLRIPVITFFHHLMFAIAITATHKCYTGFTRRKNIFRIILRKTIFYNTPTDRIIWVTSLLGLFSSFYSYFIMGIWDMETADRSPLYYVMTILSGYIWMPLIILSPKYRQIQPERPSKTIKYVVAYSIFVFFVAIASNWRTVLFSGIFIVVGLFCYSLLLQQFTLRSVISPKKLILIVAAFIVITGPMVDIAQAMVIVRGERTELSAVDFLSRTIDTYNNKSELNAAKNETLLAINNNPFYSYEWNESYLSNIILNRLVNLKISDNCLYYANEIGYQNEQMQAEMLQQTIAFMPNVILSFFNVDIGGKIYAANYSIGDYLYGLAINSSSQLGSAIISSMPGVGMAIFGYWYILLIFPLFFIIFLMFDSLVDLKNENIVFSYLFFLLFTIIINYFNDRHVFVYEFRFVLRTYFETVLIFLITMKIVDIISPSPKHKEVFFDKGNK